MHLEHHSNSRENHHLKPRGKLTPTFEVLNRKKIPYNWNVLKQIVHRGITCVIVWNCKDGYGDQG